MFVIFQHSKYYENPNSLVILLRWPMPLLPHHHLQVSFYKVVRTTTPDVREYIHYDSRSIFHILEPIIYYCDKLT